MANLEVIALNTTTPQLLAPQSGDGYAMPRPVTVTEVVGSTALTLTGATQTAALPVLNATQTWNNAATTFTAVKLNVTDTASAASSLLADFQVGGSTKASILKSGRYQSLANAGYSFSDYASGYIFKNIQNGANAITISVASVAELAIEQSGITARRYAFGTSSGDTITADAFLVRDAANTLAQRNSTTAQTFRVYNTYTDASNYERGKIAWSSNVLQIGTEKLGTGTARNVDFQTDGTTRVTVSSGGITSASGIDFVSGGGLQLAGSYQIRATSTFRISFPSDGVVTFLNWASTDFGRLQLGGTTSSFPAIKRSGTAAQIRLADDSAYAPLEASTVRTATAYTVATLPTAGTAGQRAYVTDALAPTFLGTLTGGGAVVCPVFDNGTAWVAG